MIMNTAEIVKDYISTPLSDRKNKISYLADKNLVSEQDIVDLLRNNNCVAPSGYFRTTVGSYNPNIPLEPAKTGSDDNVDLIRFLQATIKLQQDQIETLKKQYGVTPSREIIPKSILEQFTFSNSKKYLTMLSNDIRLMCFPTITKTRKQRNSDTMIITDNSMSVSIMSDDQYDRYIEVFNKVINVLKDYVKEDK